MTASEKRAALVTQAGGFGGPAATAALADAGWRVLAADPAFAEADARAAFVDRFPQVEICEAAEGAALVDEAWTRAGRIDALVVNVHFPAIHKPLEETTTEMLRDTLEALVVRPAEIVRAAVPKLKAQGGGNVVAINSNRTRLPVPGGAIPDAGRAALEAMIVSWARDLAAGGVTVNAIAPNYFYSEAYYPRARFIDDPDGRAFVERMVPAGRLGAEEEMGELVLFLCDARSRFTTGAVIDFSGGWPVGQTPASPGPADADR